ncbi:MAG TPA: helix-turn-helix transcriptional regulator [Nitrobacter sp.]|nr:helix-turn-helix transcriptional regulator [Nitrobacter sp.]
MGTDMTSAEREVLCVNGAQEKADFLSAVHKVIACVLADKPGRTLIDIAEAIDVTVQTISAAFNKRNALSATFLTRMGRVYGPHVLDPIAKLSNARMVPLEVSIQRDVLPFVARVNSKIAVARSPESPGGVREIHTEKADYLPDLKALRKELDCLIHQIEGELAA